MKMKSARRLLMVWLLVMTTTALARGPLRASEVNTSGWHLMSQQERLEHQAKIRSLKTLEACRAYQVEHHQLMLARAEAQGRPLRLKSRDFCAHLSADNVRR